MRRRHAALKPATLRAMAQPVQFDSPMMGPPGAPAPVNDDLTFRVEDASRQDEASGSRRDRRPAGRSAPSVTAASTCTDSGIEFRRTKTSATSSWSSPTASPICPASSPTAAARAVKDYSVVVFPQDRDKWIGQLALPAHGTAGPGRAIQSRRPAPGDTTSSCSDYVDSTSGTNRSFWSASARRPRASRSTKATKSVDLRINTAS